MLNVFRSISFSAKNCTLIFRMSLHIMVSYKYAEKNLNRNLRNGDTDFDRYAFCYLVVVLVVLVGDQSKHTDKATA